MNINRTGSKKQGGAFKCNSTTDITPQQMRFVVTIKYNLDLKWSYLIMIIKLRLFVCDV